MDICRESIASVISAVDTAIHAGDSARQVFLGNFFPFIKDCYLLVKVYHVVVQMYCEARIISSLDVVGVAFDAGYYSKSVIQLLFGSR